MDFLKSIFFCKCKPMIILIFFIFFSLSETTNEESNRLYPKMINLPNDKFLFVIIDGIYIFERNLLDKNKIYNFTGPKFINNVGDINKTTLSEVKFNDNLYIFCLVKNFLYLYDTNNNKIIKEINLNFYLNGKKYSLNPFINGTYLSCVISYTGKASYPTSEDIINKLNIYEITLLSVNDNDQGYLISKKEYFNKSYVDSKGESFISRDSSTCEISSNILYCFYFVENSKKIRVSGFNMSNNYEEINCNYIFEYNRQLELYEIKSFNPYNSNLIFLCYYLKYKESYNEYVRAFCIYYNIKEKKISQVENVYVYDCDNFQPYYFEETNQYILGCNNYGNLVKAFLYDENIVEIDYNYLYTLICNNIYNYLIYYNSTSKKYNIITDCYINNNDSFILANHTLFKDKKKKQDMRTNYIIPIIEIEYISDQISDTTYYPFTIIEDKSDYNENTDKSTNDGGNSSFDSSPTNTYNSDNNDITDKSINNDDNSSSDSSPTNADNSDNNDNTEENTNNNNFDNSSSESFTKYSHVIAKQTDIIELLNISKNDILIIFQIY